MKFCDKLIALRRARGLSQEQLADLVGVTRQAVGKWETGRSMPDLDRLVALAELFGTSLDELVRGADCTAASAPDASSVPQTRLPFACGFAYQSRCTLFGLPLVHINIGGGCRPRVAKGILAVGDLAIGGVAVGGLAAGILSLGGLSAGLLAFGGLAVGGLALGGVAAGALAWGGVALGIWAVGGAAFGSSVSVGGAALGPLSFGANADASFVLTDGHSKAEALALLDAARPHLPRMLRALFGLFL